MNKYKNDITESDKIFISENFEKLPIKEIARKLNKSISTIYSTIYKLNLKKENREGQVWSNEEIKYLKENYESSTASQIGLILGRTKSSVMGKAYGLKLVKSPQSRNWTDEELTYLKENINSLPYDEIAKNLPNRNLSAIYNKVYELKLIPKEYKGCRKLKREQVLFIVANADKYTDSEFAFKFNCSIEAVEEVRKKNNILKTGNEVKGKTYIEQFVENQLIANNIPYVYNQKLGGFQPDFQLLNTKVIIEVQGDYFHCNPYIYESGPKDEIQIKHVVQDYYKKCYYLSNGYTLIEIWENDINQNPEQVITVIQNLK